MNLAKCTLIAVIMLLHFFSADLCNGDTLTVTNLFSFGTSPNAWGPVDTLTQTTNIFYSTTPGGGPTGDGSIFTITTNGSFNALVYFSRTNGSIPKGGLVQGLDGNFYGTTFGGGTPDINGDLLGTVFRATPSGVITSLVSFGGTNGWGPMGRLLQGTDGFLYGTTRSGGPAYNPNTLPFNYGNGTVFRISTNGTLTTLASFDGTNGAYPLGVLYEVTNGIFYGTCSSGGISNMGTIFQISTNGTLNTLASFNGTNGSAPQAGLIKGRDGFFYGTTLNGGQSGNGTIFRMDNGDAITTLYSFTGLQNDGSNPYDVLTQGADGNLYGTTCNGGAYNLGVVFQATTTGNLTTLYSFHYDFALPRDGGQPYGGLIQSGDGYFYGTAKGGGAYGGGTFFRFPIPPTPEITAQPNRTMAFSWFSVVGGLYQLQYTTNLISTNWVNLGGVITATNVIANGTDDAPPDLQRFYRILLKQ